MAARGRGLRCWSWINPSTDHRQSWPRNRGLSTGLWSRSGNELSPHPTGVSRLVAGAPRTSTTVVGSRDLDTQVGVVHPIGAHPSRPERRSQGREAAKRTLDGAAEAAPLRLREDDDHPSNGQLQRFRGSSLALLAPQPPSSRARPNRVVRAPVRCPCNRMTRLVVLRRSGRMGPSDTGGTLMQRRTGRRWAQASVVAVALSAGLLSGCGGDDDPEPKAVDPAVTELAAHDGVASARTSCRRPRGRTPGSVGTPRPARHRRCRTSRRPGSAVRRAGPGPRSRGQRRPVRVGAQGPGHAGRHGPDPGPQGRPLAARAARRRT